MLRTLLPAAMMLLATCIATTSAAADLEATLRHQGMDRHYKIHLPDGLKPDAPLVVVLHGYGGEAVNEATNMNAVADRHGFAVCYPVGAVDAQGKRCWNVGYPFQEGLKTDDVSFLRSLVRHLQRTYRLSRQNVFCTGMSNGGEMCYQLAAQSPKTFAAVAPVSGLMMSWLYRTDRSRRAVPLLEIHGTQDVVSFWEGDPTGAGGWGAYMPVEMAIYRCAARNRCYELHTGTLPTENPAYQLVTYKYTGATNQKEVWLYQVIGGTHTWNGQGYDTGELIWEFFSHYIR